MAHGIHPLFDWHMDSLPRNGGSEVTSPALVNRRDEVDPIFHLMPKDQINRVLRQDMCDIERGFLGFTEIYMALADIIPKHWTVIDLGCAYAPQSILFKDHHRYVGVDLFDIERFSAENSEYFVMPIAEFLESHAAGFDQDRSFAICSYVPSWHSDNSALVRKHFRNVFTYYPARDNAKPDLIAKRVVDL